MTGFLTMLAGKQIFGRMIGERASRAIMIAGLALAIIFALAGAKCAYDASVISKHEAKQEAANAKADRKADANASRQRRIDDAREAQERGELERVQNNATSDLDRRLAKHRCLRLQQQARAAGGEPPAC